MYKGYDGERVQMSRNIVPPSTEQFNEPHNDTGENLLARWRRQMNENTDFQFQALLRSYLATEPAARRDAQHRRR